MEGKKEKKNTWIHWEPLPGPCDPGTRETHGGVGETSPPGGLFLPESTQGQISLKNVPAEAVNHRAVWKALVNLQPGQPSTIYGITYREMIVLTKNIYFKPVRSQLANILKKTPNSLFLPVPPFSFSSPSLSLSPFLTLYTSGSTNVCTGIHPSM